MGHHTIEITDDNFDEKVLKSEVPVLIDFWAEWCGPCIALGPTIEELAKDYQGKFVIGKMDVDKNQRIPTEFGIMNIPTLLFFNKGKMVDKHVGLANRTKLEDKMKVLV